MTQYVPAQDNRISFCQLKLQPETLKEMISLIDTGIISGKIGKQILPDLTKVTGNCFRITPAYKVCQVHQHSEM